MTERIVKPCQICQTSTDHRRQYEPLQMTKLPTETWSILYCDHFGPLPSGHYMLCIIDMATKFPIVAVTKSTNTDTTIGIMDKLFAEYGTPQELVTDNGASFNSKLFADFASHLGFYHRKVTPYWPRANGIAERFMKNLGKVVRNAQVLKRSW